ncbi:MAG: heavy metal translocating P-type ATPase [Oscillospiraceae bacterium]
MSNKKRLIVIIVAGTIFAVANIFKFSYNIEFLLFTVSYLIIGGQIILKAIKNIFKGNIFDENFLMSIATLGAFYIGQYSEGVTVMLFYQVGELFQSYAVDKSRKSISELMDIRPDYANVIRDNIISKIDPDEVSAGEIISIKPGEKVPLDAIVLTGNTSLNTSSLTGESLPRDVASGDEILSGSINLTGVITAKVTKEFYDSTAYKILDLVENASSKKSKTENFISKFAKYYTPIVVVFAVLLAIVPPFILGLNDFNFWFERALVFLVVSCPCALVISIPLGFFGGIGTASKNGILVKGSNYLEALSKADTVVFDKTGTLTKGIFKVNKIITENNFSESDLLKYTAYAEYYSNHPISISIKNAYGEEIDKNVIKNVKENSGFGVISEVDSKIVVAGNQKLMDKLNIKCSNDTIIGTCVHVSIDNIYAGYIVISDEIKTDSIKAIELLKTSGIKNIIMLTGDLKVVGEDIGKQIGINTIYSELLPQDKVEKLEEIIKNKSGKVVFVGDGINDAPVLSMADIGVSMGGVGSDAAIEASDIVIMKDEPSKLFTAINISKQTLKTVRQNIILSLVVKILVLILGAFGLSSLWEAIFADVGVSVIAILNSISIMKKNYDK